MTKRGAYARRNYEKWHGHYIVEGDVFLNMGELVGELRRRGFDAHPTTIRDRLKAGHSTWAALMKPCHKNNSQAATETRGRQREEVAEIARELDRRKAVIAKAQEEE